MKKTIGMSLLAVLATVFFAVVVYGTLEHGTIKLAPGDEIYACACGASCPCRTMSRHPGKCTCGHALIKAKVVKVAEGMAVLNVNGKEETFPLTGKYACACGGGCNCDTISQHPGKCTCGTPMAPVK